VMGVLTAPETRKQSWIARPKIIRPIRSLSGIAVVSVMSRAFKCPHGKCHYCPKGSEAARSYTGFEPAARRAREHDFDPASQVSSRLAQLKRNGHPTDKVELIVMGGTFNALNANYKRNFVKACLDALNCRKSRNLAAAKKFNETSSCHRAVGITFETRPDWATAGRIDELLEFGATRIELGVQAIKSDALYRNIGRGHTIGDVVNATRVCKDSALKVCYHMMPGLPGMSLDDDYDSFMQLFENPDFRPDMLKIYPTLVMKGTKLYSLWKKGKYTPPTEEEMVELLSRIKSKTPTWIRIMRLERDIPGNLIAAGIKSTNLRQYVWERMRKDGVSCRCIRCREVRDRKLGRLSLVKTSYEASGGGLETFISAEDRKKDILAGLVRMRYPSKAPHRPEIRKPGTALIRELHVYGVHTRIGATGIHAQHKGVGGRMLAEAESKAVEDGFKRMIVISGIGVREYYRKKGYRVCGPYMVKRLGKRRE